MGRSKNGQTLVYREYKKPDVTHGHIDADWIKDTEVILAAAAVLALIAAVIIGIVTGGWGFLAEAFLVGLLLGAVVAYKALVHLIGSDDAPSVDLLVENFARPIRWTGGKAFALDYASLNTSLQFGGSLGFG